MRQLIVGQELFLVAETDGYYAGWHFLFATEIEAEKYVQSKRRRSGLYVTPVRLYAYAEEAPRRLEAVI